MTEQFRCSYLPERKERLLVVHDDSCNYDVIYENLMAKGFRRSGDKVYTPFCPACSACESIRIPASEFKPSKSQRRIETKGQKHFHVTHTTMPEPGSYELYEKYINLRHKDGAMYPPDESQFNSIAYCSWLKSIYINLWDGETLVGVAITDMLPTALSAVYTFFDPDYQDLSPGTFAILAQIKACSRYKREHLYLGYQVDRCNKMNYKSKFVPHERLSDGEWVKYE